MLRKELGNGKRSTYKIKFPDSFKFMSIPLSNLADNLSDGIHNTKCTICISYFEYMYIYIYIYIYIYYIHIYIYIKENELSIFICLKLWKKAIESILIKN